MLLVWMDDSVLYFLDYGSGVSFQEDGMEKEEGW